MTCLRPGCERQRKASYAFCDDHVLALIESALNIKPPAPVETIRYGRFRDLVR